VANPTADLVELTDADLIARVLLREDHHAYGELVRRHQSVVRAFLARMAKGDSHLADDLAQETFLKAWKKLRTFRNTARFSTWLLGIACNEFRMAHRGRKEASLEDLGESETPQEDISTLSHAGLRIDLTEALHSLNDSERAAVILCCQDGLSHEEAALALDCPLGTVKTHVQRGKEKLRRRLSLSSFHHESASK
jgi:RNA polymerase sigma-70 factor (ECF subfamily)